MHNIYEKVNKIAIHVNYEQLHFWIFLKNKYKGLECTAFEITFNIYVVLIKTKEITHPLTTHTYIYATNTYTTHTYICICIFFLKFKINSNLFSSSGIEEESKVARLFKATKLVRKWQFVGEKKLCWLPNLERKIVDEYLETVKMQGK